MYSQHREGMKGGREGGRVVLESSGGARDLHPPEHRVTLGRSGRAECTTGRVLRRVAEALAL